MSTLDSKVGYICKLGVLVLGYQTPGSAEFEHNTEKTQKQ